MVESEKEDSITDHEFLYKNPVERKPKPIMVNQTLNIIEFSNELSSNDKLKFEAKLVGNFDRISPGSITNNN